MLSGSRAASSDGSAPEPAPATSPGRGPAPGSTDRRGLPLETDRLLLRRPEQRDLTDFFEIHSDPGAFAGDSTPPLQTVDQALDVSHLWTSHWDHYGFGYRIVELRETGEVIGFAGLQLRPLGGQTVLNLYYRFRPDRWGLGYATEACRAVVVHARSLLPAAPVVAITDEGNVRARRLAERLGLVATELDDPEETVPHVVHWLAPRKEPAAGTVDA
jgi:RimJ/RimL family protein N-acetyltransferase